MGSGIELNAVVVGKVITVVTIVAANRTSATRHRRHFFFVPPHNDLTSFSGRRKVRSYYITKIKKNPIELAYVAAHLTYVPQVYEVIFILFYSHSSNK